jgi:hypothetical protein
MLEWLLGVGEDQEDPWIVGRWKSVAVETAAKKNDPDLFWWLLRKGCALSTAHAQKIAEIGNITTRYLRKLSVRFQLQNIPGVSF